MRKAVQSFLPFAAPLCFCFALAVPAQDFEANSKPVGRSGTNGVETPTNQRLTPAGVQVELPGMRPQALALSPDGRLLVTSGLTPELVVIEPVSGRILQRVPLPSENEKHPLAEPAAGGE